jgi:hypothetical protein
MAMKYTEIFHSKAFKGIQKFELFGIKIYHLTTLKLVTTGLPDLPWG